jgi:hypothetical protein
MKKVSVLRTMAIVFANLAVTATSQAQVTPQAVIGNAPALPASEEWAANGGHTETFRAKIVELNDKLSVMTAAMIPAVTEADLQQVHATQQRKFKEQQRQNERDMKNAQKNMQQAQDALAMLELTPAEIAKLEKMSDREIEAFMRKRMAEKGVDPTAFTTEYSDEDARRDREAEAAGQAIAKAQEAEAAYIEQLPVTSAKISDARKSASEQINDLVESRREAIQKTCGWCCNAEEVMRGTVTAEQVEADCRRHQAAINDCKAAAYHIWVTEYVGVAQGHLKFLLPYAQALDDARKAQSTAISTGNAAVDQLQGMSNAAITLAGEYLSITASEPEIDL